MNNNFDANLFRTAELSPGHYYCEIPDEKKPLAVQQICDTRSELLKRVNEALIPLDKLVDFGRIMFFDANSTVHDGAPEEQSEFYVDIADMPPWDTWLATGSQLNALNFFQAGHELKDDFLVAWVPKLQYFYANAALEVACLGNFEWPANDYITNDYSNLKELFNTPDIIEPPNVFIDPTKRAAMLEGVQRELIANSKLYYQRLRVSVANKKSFWRKFAIWKSWRVR